MAENLKYWRANWQREIEGAFLYRELATLAGHSDAVAALASV